MQLQMKVIDQWNGKIVPYFPNEFIFLHMFSIHVLHFSAHVLNTCTKHMYSLILKHLFKEFFHLYKEVDKKYGRLAHEIS